MMTGTYRVWTVVFHRYETRAAQELWLDLDIFHGFYEKDDGVTILDIAPMRSNILIYDC
jgi:hypothetical protein